jgi:hypothetical protein
MKTKTHFAVRIDIWDDTSDSIVEHVAGVDDFEVAEATYRAAVARWPACARSRTMIETKNGTLFFNPGSAGPRRFRLPITVGRITAEHGKLRAEIVELSIER